MLLNQKAVGAATIGHGQKVADCAPVPAGARTTLPHPIPYQGSKRLLAPRILAYVAQRHFDTLYEPFGGSAAITIAAAHKRCASRFIIGETLPPLAALWQGIIDEPDGVACLYERLWLGQSPGDASYYAQIRDEYNLSQHPAYLLYLLARCAKNAPRFNGAGEFNQSADLRRLGRHPSRMQRELQAASRLLRGRTTVLCADVAETLATATAHDLVYLDPPYHGTTIGSDKRYHQGLPRERLLGILEDLNERGVPFLLSYDGRSGETTYGTALPDWVGARVEIEAGRSSQATLHGRNQLTVESLYISHSLLA